MRKIGNKIFWLLLGWSLLLMALFSGLGINSVIGIIQEEAQETLLWKAQSYAQSFGNEMVQLEEKVREIESIVQQTVNTEKLTTDKNYLHEYELSLVPFMKHFALNRSICDASWLYFDPKLSTVPHDIYFVGTDGDLERQAHIPFAYYDNTPLPNDDKEWWYGPIRTKKLFWSNPYNWTLRNGRIIKVASCAIPVYKNGLFIGVVGSYYPFKQMQARISDIAVYESGHASLYNEKLDVIVHPTMIANTRFTSDNLLTYKDGLLKNVGEQMLQQSSGIAFYTEHGEKMICAFSRLPNGWILSLQAPLSEVYGSLHILLRQFGISVLICLLLAAFAATILGLSITKPLLKVIAAAERMGKGDLSARVEVDTSDEIRTLAHSLNTMIENLQNSDERLKNIIAGAGMFTWNYDVRKATLQHDAQFCRAISTTEPATAGEKALPWLVEKFHPADLANIRSSIMSAQNSSGSWELRILTPEHEWHWFQIVGRVEEYGPDGQALRIAGTGFDIHGKMITALSEAEQKRKLEDMVLQRTQELEISRNEAQAASQAKTIFLSTVSHEIRTPMNAILGFIHVFDRSNLTASQKTHLEKIQLSSRTLLNIINDVLDISKIEAGKLELENTPFHVASMLDTVCSIVDLAASSKGLSLMVHVAPDVPEIVEGDTTRLSQILLNLMNNAVKFTSYGSVALDVALENAPQQDRSVGLAFSIRDTGIGLSAEQCARLFTPFMQADASVTRRYGGTGLGLAISKQLVELMGGSIAVSSAPDEGSTFRFTVSLKLPQDADKTLPQNVQPNTVATDARQQQTALQALRDKRVLVVEDNEINQEIIRLLLEEYRLIVDVADHGQTALRMAIMQHYDCILMDVQMPVMDGLEATRRLRAMGDDEDTRWLQHVPIIALTANAMREDHQRYLQAGMDDLISKPIEPQVLRTRLLHWLIPTKAA